MRVAGRRSVLERVLGLVADVRAGEGPSAALLCANVFVLMTAYALLKPVREGLILASESGARTKSYLGAAIAATLVVAVPAYAALARRVARNRLIAVVTGIFVACLVAFAATARWAGQSRALGIVFFVWLGVFNMMVVAQFWGFAADVYDEERGKRLFPLVAFGQPIGAVAGAAAARVLVERLGGIGPLMLVSAGLLVGCVGLMQWVHVRESSAERASRSTTTTTSTSTSTSTSTGGEVAGAFRQILAHRYLGLIAGFSLLFTCVNTNGEFLLGEMVSRHFRSVIAEPAEVPRAITAWFAEFHFAVNVVVVVLQSAVVARVVRVIGARRAFLIFPLVALGDALGMAFLPVLAVVRIGKIAENATDYSFNNTLRNMLWLPAARAAKYQAKQATDSFFVRLGDVTSALCVYLGAGVLGLGVRGFALLDAALVLVWLWLARAIFKEQALLERRREAGETVPWDVTPAREPA
jgi:ATP:ADP antiporter, AAA family